MFSIGSGWPAVPGSGGVGRGREYGKGRRDGLGIFLSTVESKLSCGVSQSEMETGISCGLIPRVSAPATLVAPSVSQVVVPAAGDVNGSIGLESQVLSGSAGASSSVLLNELNPRVSRQPLLVDPRVSVPQQAMVSAPSLTNGSTGMVLGFSNGLSPMFSTYLQGGTAIRVSSSPMMVTDRLVQQRLDTETGSSLPVSGGMELDGLWTRASVSNVGATLVRPDLFQMVVRVVALSAKNENLLPVSMVSRETVSVQQQVPMTGIIKGWFISSPRVGRFREVSWVP
ncbi:hypothetical protein NE237_004866 [Protea cynaroides]|uniref:Uncharacterized protein n=1 Tax=Protea cynaroides TaxID=273540 RepID=A0A9Q0KJK0_9MAGN|nr:hypothetical protein NE237_004866 [Protea cynaroides]